MASSRSQAIEPAPEDPAVDLKVDYPEPMKQPTSAGRRIPPPAPEAPPTGHAVTGAMPADDDVPAEGWTPYEHWKHNGDGTVTTESYVAPKFRPRGAQWVPVDPTVRASSRAELPFEAAGALHPVRFGNAASRLLRLDLDGGPVTVKAPALAIGRPSASGRKVPLRAEVSARDLH